MSEKLLLRLGAKGSFAVGFNKVRGFARVAVEANFSKKSALTFKNEYATDRVVL